MSKNMQTGTYLDTLMNAILILLRHSLEIFYSMFFHKFLHGIYNFLTNEENKSNNIIYNKPNKYQHINQNQEKSE